MKKLNTVILLAASFLLGACGAHSNQYYDKSSDGLHYIKENRSAFGSSRVEVWDSDMEYEDCKSDYNRRKMGPAAVDKCRQQTRSDRRKRENLRNGEAPGGTSMMGGPGFYGGPGAFMAPGYGPGGMVGPAFYVPGGRPEYEGTAADPRMSRQASGSQEDGEAETP